MAGDFNQGSCSRSFSPAFVYPDILAKHRRREQEVELVEKSKPLCLRT